MDPFGRAFIAASKNDDKVLLLSWSAGQSVSKVLGYLPVDGVISSVSVFSASATAPLVVLAAISSSPGKFVDAALSFQLTAEMLGGRLSYLNNLRELEPSSVCSTTVLLPLLSSIFLSSCISGRLTCFAASPEQNAVRQIEFELGRCGSERLEFARTLGKTATSDIAFAAPFHGLWMASLCRSGSLSVTRNINEKFPVPSSPTSYQIAFNHEGDRAVIFSSTVVRLVQLNVKAELKSKVKEITNSITENIVFKALCPTDSTNISDSSQSEWFKRQLTEATIKENKKHKSVKDKIEEELSVLSHGYKHC